MDSTKKSLRSLQVLGQGTRDVHDLRMRTREYLRLIKKTLVLNLIFRVDELVLL